MSLLTNVLDTVYVKYRYKTPSFDALFQRAVAQVSYVYSVFDAGELRRKVNRRSSVNETWVVDLRLKVCSDCGSTK